MCAAPLVKITLQQVSKRYRRDWIIRDLTDTFEPGTVTGVAGPNGSGKSTLLRMLSGQLTPSRGRLTYHDTAADEPVSIDTIYRQVAYAAPYIDPLEELTLAEAIDFHYSFQQLLPGFERSDLPATWQLEHTGDKYIHQFSSGMQRRLQLGLALCSTAPILLLDEPTITLDRAGIDWFSALLSRCTAGRTVVIASNVEEDLAHCGRLLDLGEARR
ncbi:MAG: ABC transporter ATP-binding protein [Saprospiraceae bacterium]